ncbi:MAG: hypothetical protein HQK86_00155 [Nitrospinae bacterium]|nr:hypothetical protein [Nitrospinota bacterium]MBF0634626.1 hypothetical protein [Nitrospinota bacterium]
MSINITADTISPETCETVVMNTANKAVSEYSGFNFNSVCRVGRHYMAANSSGIHILRGDSDNGAPINAEMKTGMTDFSEIEGVEPHSLKRITDAHIGMRASGAVTFKTYPGDGAEKSHEITGRGYFGLRQRRVFTLVRSARGIRSRLWSFGLANQNGAGFDLRDMTLEVFPLSRKEK